jgi:hypothetical protein
MDFAGDDDAAESASAMAPHGDAKEPHAGLAAAAAPPGAAKSASRPSAAAKGGDHAPTPAEVVPRKL